MIDIVKYDEDFDKILKDFETNSAAELGEEFPSSHILISTKFNFKFSSKSSAYKNYEIYLGLDKKTREVLSLLIFSVKSFQENKDLIKVLQIITVKVHPEVRRQGIARKLLKFAEKAAVKKGAIRAIAKVQDNNFVSRSLFQRKLGFSEVSILKTVIIEPPCKNSEVLQISEEAYLKLTEEYYSLKESFPKDFRAILSSEAYLGSYVLLKGEDWVSASLWNMSYYSEAEISTVLIDKKYFLSASGFTFFLLLLVISCCLLVSAWVSTVNYFEDKAYKITVFVLFLLFAVFAVQWLYIVLKYLIEARKTRKPRLKIFGVCYNNSLENKKETALALFRDISGRYDNEYTCFEFHEDDIYSSLFIKSEASYKCIYQKSLNNSLVFKWNKRHFIDPRE